MLLASLVEAGCTSAHGRRGAYIDFMRPDRRPPLVGSVAVADSLWGPMSESSRGDGIADHRRDALQELVDRFAPTLVLPKADHVTVEGRRYQLIPADATLFADTLRLDLISAAPYAFRDSIDIALGAAATDSLVTLAENALQYQSDPDVMPVWYFDWPGDNVREWWRAYAAARQGGDSARWTQPTVYGHPFVDPAGRVVIQYWYFYPFNDFISNHEGDWEHINVVLADDHATIEQVHYFFHARSIRLPQGRYRPEIIDGTHPVVYVGGRAYNVLDFPIRLLRGEKNEGSHGLYPYPGEWEAAGALGAPESVHKADKDSTRVMSYRRFTVVLTPEPGRIDYRRNPNVLREWFGFLLPVRWGYPSAPSFGSTMGFDVGNRAPFGPPYNAGWNRTGPGLQYAAYHVRRIPFLRSLIEDLLQPWYYLYIFRTPRYAHDTRAGQSRQELARLGLAPRGGWAERGFGSPNLGVHLAWPVGDFDDAYRSGTGFLVWRNLWAKVRLGAFEVLGGYQKFRPTDPAPGGSLFVYPFTGNLVVRAPDALIRPYAAGGVGAYGWESRVRLPSDEQLVTSGWNLGWNVGLGVEYYLRTSVALDVGLRFHRANGPAGNAGMSSGDLHFTTLWIGHFIRF